jgi:hypothetical protein
MIYFLDFVIYAVALITAVVGVLLSVTLLGIAYLMVTHE